MKQYNRFRMVNRNREYITLGELAKVIAGKIEELLVCKLIMTTQAVAYVPRKSACVGHRSA